jgi:alcohol dehydrogenase (cytochrome c)
MSAPWTGVSSLDMKTGAVAWDTKLEDSAKLTVGFTGAPLYAKGTVVIGSQGVEWPARGPIFGVDAATGKAKWQFDTAGGTAEAGTPARTIGVSAFTTRSATSGA